MFGFAFGKNSTKLYKNKKQTNSRRHSRGGGGCLYSWDEEETLRKPGQADRKLSTEMSKGDGRMAELAGEEVAADATTKSKRCS